MKRDKEIEKAGLIEGVEGEEKGVKLDEALDDVELTGRIERELEEFKTSVDDVLNESDQLEREDNWEKMLESEKYGQYLEKNPQIKEYMMEMTKEEYERLNKDLNFYLYNKTPEQLEKIFADPKNLEHHLNILNNEYHDEKLADLYQYGVNPENKESLKDFMKKNPALFERSFSGLPAGESLETIEQKITEAGFSPAEKEQIVDYISDFRNYEYGLEREDRKRIGNRPKSRKPGVRTTEPDAEKEPGRPVDAEDSDESRGGTAETWKYPEQGDHELVD
jgi:hypothetical protein